MVFPVQTRMFARLNFFKVTLRSMWEDYSDFISNFRDDLEEPYINCSQLSFSKMFTTGSLGDYLGVPTRKSYYASSTYADSSIASCTESAKISLIKSSYSWNDIVSSLGFNKSLSGIPGITCAKSYDDSSTVLLKSGVMKVHRYKNASMLFSVINDVKRNYISRGLLVGISPGDAVVRTWEFNIPVDTVSPTVMVNIPLCDMVKIGRAHF